MRDAKLKDKLDPKEAPRKPQRLAPPGKGGKRMAGKFAQTLLHAAPSNQHVHVARGVYQFQRHRPWVASAASLAGFFPVLLLEISRPGSRRLQLCLSDPLSPALVP
jgi:hypothetical protein